MGDQGQGLARNLDPESPDPGQPADLGPGVDPRGRDLDRPSQEAAQGLALAVRLGPGPRVEQGQGLGVLGGDQGQEVQQSQGREVQGNQGPEVQPNLDPEVQQQGQGPQAHQGRGQGLPEAIEINHQFKCTGYVLLLFVSCGLKCPYIIGLKSYFWLS